MKQSQEKIIKKIVFKISEFKNWGLKDKKEFCYITANVYGENDTQMPEIESLIENACGTLSEEKKKSYKLIIGQDVKGEPIYSDTSGLKFYKGEDEAHGFIQGNFWAYNTLNLNMEKGTRLVIKNSAGIVLSSLLK